MLATTPVDKERTRAIYHSIEALKQSLYLGTDPDILENDSTMPDALKKKWIDLLYRENELIDLKYLEELIRILEVPYLNLPYRNKSKKSLIRLKVLAEIMGQLERNTNRVLRQVLTSHDNKINSNVLDRADL